MDSDSESSKDVALPPQGNRNHKRDGAGAGDLPNKAEPSRGALSAPKRLSDNTLGGGLARSSSTSVKRRAETDARSTVSASKKVKPSPYVEVSQLLRKSSRPTQAPSLTESSDLDLTNLDTVQSLFKVRQLNLLQSRPLIVVFSEHLRLSRLSRRKVIVQLYSRYLIAI